MTNVFLGLVQEREETIQCEREAVWQFSLGRFCDEGASFSQISGCKAALENKFFFGR